MILTPARAILTVGLVLIATTCQAGTVSATLGTPTNNQSVVININTGDPSSSFFSYGYAGYIPWTQAAGSDPAFGPVGHVFTTFCIELTQDVGIGGNYTFTTDSLKNAPNPGTSQSQVTPGTVGMGTAKADAIGRLWNGFYSQSMSLPNAAAFQLAIWRIEYDWGSSTLEDFTTGNFRANSSNTDGNAAITQAQVLLGHVINNDYGYTVGAPNLVALTGACIQDQVSQTPEPTSLCLSVIGGLALSIVGYHRRKSGTASLPVPA
jgi:hypothetical protein